MSLNYLMEKIMKKHKFFIRAFVVCGAVTTILSCCYFVAKISFAQEQIEATQPLVRDNTKPSLAPAKSIDLKSVGRENQKRFLETFSIERHQEEEELISQIFSNDNQVKCMAAYLLGLKRYEGAVSSLSEQITLQDEKYSELHNSLWFWDQYPALEALVRIGKPSTPAMVTNIEASDDKLVRELSLKAIRAIEGVEIAQFILERAIAKQENPAKKANLEAALVELQKQPQ